MATPKKPARRSGSRSASGSTTAKKRGGATARKSPAKRTASGTARKSPAKRTASGTARKSPAKRTASGTARKSTAKRPTPASAGKASAKTVRKTAPKSGTKAQAKAAAAAVPEIAVPPRRAADVKAASTTPSLRPGRRRSVGRWAAVAGLLAAIVVVIVLLASGGSDDNNTNLAATTPTATTPTPTATAPSAAAPAAAAPAAKPVVRTQKCDPIIGTGTVNGGRSYDVTSSAKDGDPIGCSEAHSILLSALSGQGTTVGDWSCKTNPGAATVATCTSTGGRSIQARG